MGLVAQAVTPRWLVELNRLLHPWTCIYIICIIYRSMTTPRWWSSCSGYYTTVMGWVAQATTPRWWSSSTGYYTTVIGRVAQATTSRWSAWSCYWPFLSLTYATQGDFTTTIFFLLVRFYASFTEVVPTIIREQPRKSNPFYYVLSFSH